MQTNTHPDPKDNDELRQAVELDELIEDLIHHLVFRDASAGNAAAVEYWRNGERITALEAIRRLISTHVVRARVEENRYYANLLKLNSKSADDKTSIKISLRKIFEYRLKELNARLKSQRKEQP